MLRQKTSSGGFIMIASAPSFVQLVQEFFCGHLVNQRNASPWTVASYRDTFRLLLNFLNMESGKKPSHIEMRDVTPSAVVAFLKHLETKRHNSIRTRNNRFAALRAFLRYASGRDPASLSTIQQVLAIPLKRFDRPQMGFLSREEIQVILDMPDSSTWSGRRDRIMFATLYNTGARVSELASAKVADLSLDHTSASLRLHGKGRKERTVPLWKETRRALRVWLRDISADATAPLFPNISGKFMTRSGVEYRLHSLVMSAQKRCPSLKTRRISPHTFRHTTAMHLLQSGVDITVIALWLGHESPVTTHMYVEADLTMKERALAKVQEPGTRPVRYRASDKLLKFLDTL
jgi:integrase/recombinase XerD